jgi:small-conductance mechanosensitive channel
MDVLKQTFGRNTLATWLLALVVTVVVLAILLVLRRLVTRRALAWVQRTETDLDNLVVSLFDRTWRLFLATVAIYAGSLVLTLPQEIGDGLRVVMVTLFLVQAGLWGNGVIDYLVSRQMEKRSKEDDAAAATVINALDFVGKAILWTVALLLALDNIPGVEVGALIASLGIGGVAVALAVQNILGDLFASLSIVLDQPFVIGDFITVDEYAGAVEDIGLKSTRLRSITGEQLVFANSDLLDSRIHNYGRMERRRVAFTLGVACETPYEKLVALPRIVQDIVEAQPQTSFDRAHWKGFGAFSFDFEVVYYLSTSDYNAFMDVQQAINLEILGRLAEERIELPYPTQTVFVAQSRSGTPSGSGKQQEDL